MSDANFDADLDRETMDDIPLDTVGQDINMDDKPIPVTRDGGGKMIKDYSLLDWADALDEERTEAIDAAVKYRQHPSWNNRKHLLEELADIKTVCTSWQSAIGADEDERAEIQREVNEKNRRRGYLG